MDTPSATASLVAYIEGRAALTSHIHALFEKYKNVYSSLAMDVPTEFLGLATPTVANFDGLTGTVLLADGTRVSLWELENPEKAARGLRNRLCDNIARQVEAMNASVSNA